MRTTFRLLLIAVPWLLVILGSTEAQQPAAPPPAQTQPTTSRPGTFSERSLALVLKTKDAARGVGDYSAVFNKREYYRGKEFSAESIALSYSARLGKLAGKSSGWSGKQFVFDLKKGTLRAKLAVMPFALELDPFDSRALANNHHSVHKLGLQQFADTFHRFFTPAYEARTGDMGEPEEVVKYGRKLWRIKLVYATSGKGRRYTLQKGDTYLELEQKLGTSINVLLNVNDGVDDYADLTPGTTVFVPEGYGSWLYVFLDQEHGWLVGQEIYDHQGRLFNNYHYEKVETGRTFSEKDFDL